MDTGEKQVNFWEQKRKSLKTKCPSYNLGRDKSQKTSSYTIMWK